MKAVYFKSIFDFELIFASKSLKELRPLVSMSDMQRTTGIEVVDTDATIRKKTDASCSTKEFINDQRILISLKGALSRILFFSEDGSKESGTLHMHC